MAVLGSLKTVRMKPREFPEAARAKSSKQDAGEHTPKVAVLGSLKTIRIKPREFPEDDRAQSSKQDAGEHSP